MFPWEVHNGWSPSLVQLISVISAIGWAPASLNPLSLLHLPPPPPPPTFFSFSRASFPRVNDRFCAPVSQRAAPLNPSLDGSSTVSRWKWKRRKEKEIAGPTRWTSPTKFFQIVSFDFTFPVSWRILSSLFLFFFMENQIFTTRRKDGEIRFIHSSNIVTRLYIYFEYIFCVSFARP